MSSRTDRFISSPTVLTSRRRGEFPATSWPPSRCSASSETLVTFINQPAGGNYGTLKVCKLTETPAYLGRLFSFSANGGPLVSTEANDAFDDPANWSCRILGTFQVGSNVTVHEAIPAGSNQMPGTVVDASYLGVSTSYIVEARGGARITVYEQNVERATRAELWEPGEEVRLVFSPTHTFAVASGGEPPPDVPVAGLAAAVSQDDAAPATVAGVALGFGAQNIVKDFLAGIFIAGVSAVIPWLVWGGG